MEIPFAILDKIFNFIKKIESIKGMKFKKTVNYNIKKRISEFYINIHNRLFNVFIKAA